MSSETSQQTDIDTATPPTQDEPAVDPASDTQGDAQCVGTLIGSFYEQVSQLVEAMIEVWPECKELRKKKLELDLACVHAPESLRNASRAQLIGGYHRIMSAKYTLCTKRDDSVMTDSEFHKEVPLLSGIDFDQKWTSDDIDEETKENMWEYILNLNRLANMHNLYSKVPTDMMRNIESMADNIHTNMEQGKMDMNLETISGQVMKNFKKEDLTSFAQHLSQNMGDITSVCSMLGDMLKPGTLSAKGTEGAGSR